MVLNVHRNHKAYYRDGEKEVWGGGGGGRGLYIYTCRYIVTTRMIPALRWASMRATDLNVL